MLFKNINYSKNYIFIFKKEALDAANTLNERVKLAEEETKLLGMKSSKLEAQMNVYKVLAEKVCSQHYYYYYNFEK